MSLYEDIQQLGIQELHEVQEWVSVRLGDLAQTKAKASLENLVTLMCGVFDLPRSDLFIGENWVQLDWTEKSYHFLVHLMKDKGITTVVRGSFMGEHPWNECFSVHTQNDLIGALSYLHQKCMETMREMDPPQKYGVGR